VLQGVLVRSSELKGDSRDAVLAQLTPHYTRRDLNSNLPAGVPEISSRRFRDANQLAALGQTATAPQRLADGRRATSDKTLGRLMEFVMQPGNVRGGRIGFAVVFVRVCVCVCACVRMRVCMCVCVCVRAC
jgi:hypothetical protein